MLIRAVGVPLWEVCDAWRMRVLYRFLGVMFRRRAEGPGEVVSARQEYLEVQGSKPNHNCTSNPTIAWPTVLKGAYTWFIAAFNYQNHDFCRLPIISI